MNSNKMIHTIRNVRTMTLVSAALAASMLSQTVHAKDRWFEIELVLFERHNEDSSEKFSLHPTSYAGKRSLNILPARFAQVYNDCPTLDQFTRQQLSTHEPLVIDSAVNIDERVMCYGPQEHYFAQAYQIRRQRITLNANSLEFSNNSLQQTDQQAPVFLPYPAQFTYDGINYQMTMHEGAPSKMPRRISAESMPDELTNIHLLDKEHLQLTGLTGKMRWAKKLSPVLHLGWRQPVLSRSRALPFHLFGGENYAKHFNIDGSEKIDVNALPAQSTLLEQINSTLETTTEQQSNEMVLTSQPVLATDITSIVAELQREDGNSQAIVPPVWQLDGLLKIYLRRFLFIEADFDFRQPGHRILSDVEKTHLMALLADEQLEITQGSSLKALSELAPQVVQQADLTQPSTDVQLVPATVGWLNSSHFKQNRRVRSNEIHYFDHPQGGLVIQIRRIEKPQS
ncbi:MAG: hypothetical protein HRU25_12790 [Psychrobium sp.]|nr:hypothetical protein [Psychrobium sp.]